MLGNVSCVFTEPDEYETNASEAKIECVVPGRGQFKATHTRVELGELLLLRNQEELANISYVGLAPQLVFVALPKLFDPPPIWNGQELRSGELVFHGRGEHIHHRTSGASEKGFIALTPEKLASWGRILAEKEIAPPTCGRILRPSSRSAGRLLYLFGSACRLVEMSPETIAHPEVARALEQELIPALIACLLPDERTFGPSFKPRHSAVMSRFEEALAAHAGGPLHMPDLCRAIDTSERTLRTCCADFLGLSPARYFRLRQLKFARTALRKSDPATASVGAIAKRYGFGEVGRFASLYRTAYGETPSTTLQARRRQDA